LVACEGEYVPARWTAGGGTASIQAVIIGRRLLPLEMIAAAQVSAPFIYTLF
jgi:hypothetical protein